MCISVFEIVPCLIKLCKISNKIYSLETSPELIYNC